MTATTAYIAVGSNLGDRAALIEAGLAELGRTPGVVIRRRSSLIETAPVGGPDQPPYLNGAVEVSTVLPPRELLAAMLAIEARLGRRRWERNGPRTLDLDLILYGDQVVDEPGLRLPHPRMHERRFVLAPLAEIAPGASHPILRTSVRSLLVGLGDP